MPAERAKKAGSRAERAKHATPRGGEGPGEPGEAAGPWEAEGRRVGEKDEETEEGRGEKRPRAAGSDGKQRGGWAWSERERKAGERERNWERQE